MIVTVDLWKSESPVSRVSELQILLSLFVNTRSIVLGFSGFLKHLGFFIKFLRKCKLQKFFKFVSVVSELKSPSNMKVIECIEFNMSWYRILMRVI